MRCFQSVTAMMMIIAPAAALSSGLSERLLAQLSKSTGVSALPVQGGLPALSGPVANGFGRGSRKLGIPTANLPCSLFQEELAELPCGVYVGWAGVRGGVHKCVCNVGFSPTFAGEENPEKIVEAHLMASFDSDFYGDTMRLLLLGFIRDERKFSGIDELLSTIKGDIETGRAELDIEPLASLARAPFLLDGTDAADASFRLLSDSELTAASAPIAASGSLDPPPPPGFTWGSTF